MGLLTGLVTTPAPVGSIITLWGTGFGPTDPAINPGEVVTNSSPLANNVTIRIGTAQATVLYAGVTAAGLCQFNIVVPSLASGDYPVVATVAGVRSASMARLRIER